jgi:hypothetical protein
VGCGGVGVWLGLCGGGGGGGGERSQVYLNVIQLKTFVCNMILVTKSNSSEMAPGFAE